MDKLAAASGDQAKWLRSASIYRDCGRLEGIRDGVEREKLMEGQAVAASNFLKGGDVEQAQLEVQAFERRYPGRDLYLEDGGSFLDSMRTLLAMREAGAAPANLGDGLDRELRRIRYWRGR